MGAIAINAASSAPRAAAGRCLRCLLGVLLVAAAIAKALSPAESASIAMRGWPVSLHVAAIELELVLGVLLIAGIAERVLHGVALIAFAGFAFLALQGVMAGKESCGCFGAVAIDPRITLAADLAAVFALFLTWPQPRNQDTLEPERSQRLIMALAGMIAIGVPLGAAVIANAPERDVVTALSARNGFVLLEPTKWIGGKLPLLNVLDDAAGIEKGSWTILLYHNGCPECDRIKPGYEMQASQGDQILLVETPPYSSPVGGQEHRSRHARLPEDRDWFVQTPVEITTRDGVVMSVKSDFPETEEAKL